MKKNSLMRYIDSCVSDIARKIQDEFDESKHPRDEGGKFTTKGGEGAGGGTAEAGNTKESAVEIDPDVEHTIRSEIEYDLDSIWEDAESVREYVDNAVAHLENTLEDTASTDHAADVNYGASKEQVEAVFRKLIDELVEENKSRIEEEENDPGYGKDY